MLAAFALALADLSSLDEWRQRIASGRRSNRNNKNQAEGTAQFRIDPMTGHASEHTASARAGWGGYEEGWDEKLEAEAAGLVANMFEDLPLPISGERRRPELAQVMKAWFHPDQAELANEYEDERTLLMKTFPEKYGRSCRFACMTACIKKCPPEIHLGTCEETNCAPQCRTKCKEMGMDE